MDATTRGGAQSQPIWRKLRKRRKENLPTQMALTVAMMACLAVLAMAGVFGDQQEPEHLGSGIRQLSVASPASHGRQLAQTVVNLTPPGACPAPAAENSTFPALGFDLVNQKAEATVFYLVITAFMFLGLAIVCDQFFESSLSAICEAMSLKDDVAGATWMAAGGSAPELATSLIGVFISRSDVGFGTIVGSAVFNVLFVIACCAFVAPNLKLSWWPLARDASYYCFSLAMIVFFVSDDLQIAVWEATTLLIMYGGYITVMYYNEDLEAWVTERVKQNENSRGGMQNSLIALFENPIFSFVLYAIILANSAVVIAEMHEFNVRAAALPCICGVAAGAAQLPNTTLFYVNLAFNIFFILEMLIKFYAYGFFGYWKVPLNCFDGSLVFLIVVELVLTSSSSVAGDDPFADSQDSLGVGVARMFRLLKFLKFIRMLRIVRLGRMVTGSKTNDSNQVAPEGMEKPKKDVEGAEPAEEDDDDDDDDEPFNPMEIPDGWIGRFFWLLGLPLAIAFFLTIPDCRRERFKTWWPATFTMCILWIAILASVMVWMVERFGVLYGVPSSVMGVTLLAAGTSIPDCLSSIAVARRGHGDMAVSSSIGSNIFDVLIGLPVPWFIYTAILRPAMGPTFGNQWWGIDSSALAIMILSLFVMVALVITTIHLSGWILSVKLGMMMMGLYLCFVALSLMLEYGVIFPDCIPNLEQFIFAGTA